MPTFDDRTLPNWQSGSAAEAKPHVLDGVAAEVVGLLVRSLMTRASTGRHPYPGTRLELFGLSYDWKETGHLSVAPESLKKLVAAQRAGAPVHDVTELIGLIRGRLEAPNMGFEVVKIHWDALRAGSSLEVVVRDPLWRRRGAGERSWARSIAKAYEDSSSRLDDVTASVERPR